MLPASRPPISATEGILKASAVGLRGGDSGQGRGVVGRAPRALLPRSLACRSGGAPVRAGRALLYISEQIGPRFGPEELLTEDASPRKVMNAASHQLPPVNSAKGQCILVRRGGRSASSPDCRVLRPSLRAQVGRWNCIRFDVPERLGCDTAVDTDHHSQASWWQQQLGPQHDVLSERKRVPVYADGGVRRGAARCRDEEGD